MEVCSVCWMAVPLLSKSKLEEYQVCILFCRTLRLHINLWQLATKVLCATSYMSQCKIFFGGSLFRDNAA